MPAPKTSGNVARKLAAILSADVARYSRLMGEDEVGTIRSLTATRAVTDPLIAHYHGRIVSTAGDSILAEFASAVAAVLCALEIQQALKAKNADLPAERRMEFRIGIDVGDVVVEGEQIYGDGVNIAAPGRKFAQHYAIIHTSMESPCARKNVTSRVIRKGEPLPEDQEWENSTPEERINAVWDLTLLCLAWQRDHASEPRLQRSISRIQRPGR